MQNLWSGSFHFHCACYPYLDNKNSYFKFASSLIWPLLQAIIIDNFHLLLRYFCKTILTVLPDSFYDLKWPIYSGFLIGECTFSTISSGTSAYFFQTILGVVQYISYNLKSPPYAPVVYVQNIEMCIHSQGVRISIFSNISTFSRLFFWC